MLLGRARGRRALCSVSASGRLYGSVPVAGFARCSAGARVDRASSSLCRAPRSSRCSSPLRDRFRPIVERLLRRQVDGGRSGSVGVALAGSRGHPSGSPQVRTRRAPFLGFLPPSGDQMSLRRALVNAALAALRRREGRGADGRLAIGATIAVLAPGSSRSPSSTDRPSDRRRAIDVRVPPGPRRWKRTCWLRGATSRRTAPWATTRRRSCEVDAGVVAQGSVRLDIAPRNEQVLFHRRDARWHPDVDLHDGDRNGRPVDDRGRQQDGRENRDRRADGEERPMRSPPLSGQQRGKGRVDEHDDERDPPDGGDPGKGQQGPVRRPATPRGKPR